MREHRDRVLLPGEDPCVGQAEQELHEVDEHTRAQVLGQAVGLGFSQQASYLLQHGRQRLTLLQLFRGPSQLLEGSEQVATAVELSGRAKGKVRRY
jgi:hypothetical protein